jgi:hypothetical protein
MIIKVKKLKDFTLLLDQALNKSIMISSVSESGFQQLKKNPLLRL